MNLTGLQRNTIDKFYTKINVASQCIRWVSEHINIDNTDVVIEPSAGNGSFIEGLRNISNHCLFYDIEPEHPDVIKQDFLEYSHSKLDEYGSNIKIHVVGNPPFGRQSTLAIRFIKNACSFAHSISFILPCSFKKDSMRNKIPREFHLVFERELPEKSFSVDGKDINVPCVFQIWEKRKVLRNKPEVEKPIGFEFVTKNDPHDISFRRVGVNAGVVDTETNNKSPQSHYFIRFTNNCNLNDNVTRVRKLQYETNNTVGPKSISKPEVIQAFNPVI
jgi:predicted RNA methylase